VSPADNPDRKLKYTLEMTKIEGAWIGVNTHRPNKIVAEALKEGKLLFKDFETEYSLEDSRFDFYFPKEKMVLEIKSVSLKKEGIALFPDTVSTRAQKHVEDLMKLKKKGYRVGVLFLIQRMDTSGFKPSEEHDPDYARILKKAKEEGLEVFAYDCNLSPGFIELNKPVPVCF
jgi:sugar fermentation stimulation protein A